jgi:succinate dehydrogenase/fumarate reductase-like Fe-S protein
VHASNQAHLLAASTMRLARRRVVASSCRCCSASCAEVDAGPALLGPAASNHVHLVDPCSNFLSYIQIRDRVSERADDLQDNAT